MYEPQRLSQSRWLPLRGLQYYVQRWGATQSSLPPVVLAHGWMDVGASFQFVIDALPQAFYTPRTFYTFDWRGFGQTQDSNPDHYWFPDYLADLEFILDHIDAVHGSNTVDLIGHSMGGNVAMTYAGARPERIRKLINLEGFGTPKSNPNDAPARTRSWFDDIKKHARGELELSHYDSADGVARRLMKTNPRLPESQAQWLARQWAQPNAITGKWHIQGTAGHKTSNATLSRVDEAQVYWAAITAPTLCVVAEHSKPEQFWGARYSLAEYLERLKIVPNLQKTTVSGAGHMLHHDQPQQVAGLIAQFLT